MSLGKRLGDSGIVALEIGADYVGTALPIVAWKSCEMVLNLPKAAFDGPTQTCRHRSHKIRAHSHSLDVTCHS